MVALTHVFFPIALLLLSSSLIIIASATDYSYPSKPEVYQTKPKEDVKYPDIYKPKPEEHVKIPKVYIPKVEVNVKLPEVYKPKPEEYVGKPKPEEKYPEVGTPKPDDVEYSEVEQPKLNQEDVKYPEANKPKPEEGVEYTKIDKPKPQQKYPVEEKTEPEDVKYPEVYTPKPEGVKYTKIDKPKPEQKYPVEEKTEPEPKPEDVKYPEVYTPKPEEKVNVPSGYVDKPDEVKEDQFPVCFEGLVLCKSGSSYEPIQGAVAKIICIAVDVLGYETRLPVSTCKTDAKGYFFSTLDYSLLEDGLKLRECKAFIESSPLEYCKVPTDVNNGITGALLSTYRILNDRKMKLYSVNPFFYTTEPKSVPSGY